LHIIVGDANLSELSTYLKVGTMRLFLAMLEDRHPVNDLTLADPVSALVQISHDPSCRQTVLLADGRRLTAVEIQMHFAEAAQRYLDATADARQEATVLRLWIDTLQKLNRDPQALHRVLDWVIKWNFLNDWRSRKDLSWSASELKELDIRYHDIDRENGIFYLLESSGKVDRLVGDQDVQRAVHEPVSETRAVIRSQRLNRDSRIRSASWATIVEDTADGSVARMILNDPTLSA
jgi:Pup amidohydrolase